MAHNNAAVLLHSIQSIIPERTTAMSIISRYILRAHIGPFLFGSCTVMLLFLLQFLMRYIDQLVGKGLGAGVIIELIVLNLAWMVVLAVPMGVLVSTLMGFGNLSSSNEITIVKSSGGSLLRMMRPVVMAAILVFGTLFWFNDYVLPDANHRAKILLSDIQRKKPTFAVERGQFSSQIDGYSILARQMDSTGGTLGGVTIYDYTKFNRLNVVSADSGIIAFSPDFTKLIFTLYKGEIHQINHQNYGDYRKVRFDRHQIAMNASGFAFTQSDEGVFSRGDREMRISDMQKIVDESRKSIRQTDSSIQTKLDNHFAYLWGTPLPADTVPQQPAADTTEAVSRTNNRLTLLRSTLEGEVFQRHDQVLNIDKYLVEIHKKYAIPAACLVFILVGCPLGIITRRGNFGISAAISLGFYILYWACLISGEKLADRGVIAPWLGMWLANIIIGCIGIILTIRVSNESFAVGFTSLTRIFSRAARQ